MNLPNILKASAILGFLLLAACGSSTAAPAASTKAPSTDGPCATCTSKPPTTPASYDWKQVFDYLHLAADVSGFAGYVYTAPGSGLRCEVSVSILVSAAEVSEWTNGSHFAIATNPDRTAGVIIWSTEKAICKRLLTEALVGFPPK